jgi:hypothetical protein
MERGYGGPVWHASVRGLMRQGRALCEQRALVELDRLGTAAAGEWREWEPRGGFMHIRRRLKPWEARGLELRDIRGTHEARLRAEALGPVLVSLPPFLIRRELGGP